MSEIQNIQVSNHGAELQSLFANGHEYLWQGDSKFWGRRAPILFPIVGRLAGDTLRVDGKEYSMKQHGFARDAEFVQEGENHYRMVKTSHANYLYDFDLFVEYHVEGDTLSCLWKVQNKGKEEIHFQIGAHPAFNLPDYKIEDEIHGYLQCIDANGQVILPSVDSYLLDGLRHQYVERKSFFNEKSMIAITNDTFKDDAIIFEKGQVASVVLLDKNRNKVLGVSCPQAEAVGLWAPNKPGCPFVCIEPWCGIADYYNYSRNISEREYNHSLVPGNTYLFNYSIQVFLKQF